jgi:hypothetical protein
MTIHNSITQVDFAKCQTLQQVNNAQDELAKFHSRIKQSFEWFDIKISASHIAKTPRVLNRLDGVDARLCRDNPNKELRLRIRSEIPISDN